MVFREFNLVIEQGGVKRKLEGAFRLCLSRATAERLREQLQQADYEGFSYGWIDIIPELTDETMPNSAPRAWKD